MLLKCNIYLVLIIIWSTFLIPLKSLAQVEVNLLTYCTTSDIKIPIQIKNFDNVASFELKLDFNPNVLSFVKSEIHNSIFTINNDNRYSIQIVNETNSIKIKWSAYYGVSLNDELLLLLDFDKIGNGTCDFSWDQTLSHILKIGNAEQPVVYNVSSPLTIPINSTFNIKINQLIKGCRNDSENGCKAQAEVVLTGAQQPYSYQWKDKFNQRTPIAIGLCENPVSVVVRDATGCYFGDTFYPNIYAANEMHISASPEVAYITKPLVEFQSSFIGTEPQAYKWDFGDNTNAAVAANPSHSYENIGSFNISLWTRSDEGCDTTVYINNYEVRELDFCIPNVFTPNGDNINDRWVFKIGNPPASDNGGLKTGSFETKNCTGEDLIFSEHFKHTRLIVINRNGQKVYECSDCKESWDGGNLPDGVYFYVFEWEGEYSNGRNQGDVTILNGK